MAEYAQKLNSIAVDNGRLCYFGIGWDPGLFSLCRALFSSVIPNCDVQTFWGKGVSQGHSEAIRRIDGVLLAKQYTVPKENALKVAREGRGQLLSVRDKHLRECYVVAKEGANKAVIEDKIKNMPDYFAPYDTIVHFISKEEFEKSMASPRMAVSCSQAEIPAVKNAISNCRSKRKAIRILPQACSLPTPKPTLWHTKMATEEQKV